MEEVCPDNKVEKRRGGADTMKQLLHTLYITEPDAVVRREVESLLAVRGDGQKDRIPLRLLE